MAWNADHCDALMGAAMCLSAVIAHGGQLIEAAERLESTYRRVAGPIDNGHFYVPTDTREGLESTNRPSEDNLPRDQREARRLAITACLRLRGSIHLAKQSIAHVAPVMDDQREGMATRWSVRAIATLRKIGGATQKGHGQDFYPSALPMVRAGVPDALRKYLDELGPAFENVKSALAAMEALRPDPATEALRRAVEKRREIEAVDPEDLIESVADSAEEADDQAPPQPVKGRSITDADMRRALETLDGSRCWGIDQLPAEIDAAMLRCLDDRGWIEVRIVTMRNVQEHPADKTPPVSMSGAWFSPIQKPGMAGGWEKVAGQRMRDTWHHPPEVRVSERGKAELSRAEPARMEGAKEGGSGESVDRQHFAASEKAQQPSDGDRASVGSGITDWKVVQGQLWAKRERGEAYSNLRLLASEFGCSDATIRKAINHSKALSGWASRIAKPKAAPKATDLSAADRENVPQTREAAPDEVLPEDDVDTIMARLIDQAKPEERARLNALDDAGRRNLAATYHAQNLDDESSPLESDKPGERHRKVTQHKRA